MSFHWGPPNHGNAPPPPMPPTQGPPAPAAPPVGLGVFPPNSAVGFTHPIPAANPYATQASAASGTTNANAPLSQGAVAGTTNTNPPVSQGVQTSNSAQPSDDDEDEDDEEDSDDEDPDNIDPDTQYDDASPIVLRLRVPINVNGNHNVIAIDASKMARTVSTAIVEALQKLSLGTGGVPMVDANGEPRPIKFSVDCKLNVKGDKNTIGEKAVMSLIPHMLRSAMVNGMLPVSPLSQIEDKHLEALVDRNRAMLAAKTKAEDAAKLKAEEMKKRERSDSPDANGKAKAPEQGESSKRPRVQ